MRLLRLHETIMLTPMRTAYPYFRQHAADVPTTYPFFSLHSAMQFKFADLPLTENQHA